MKKRTRVSIWEASREKLPGPALSRGEKADVCVIGAGIAGLTTALLLARQKYSVILLEAKLAIAAGESAATTAHLTNVLDNRYADLEKIHGHDAMKLAARSHAAAVDFIETLSEEIPCDFERVDGHLFSPDSQWDLRLQDEVEAAARAGLTPEQAALPLDGFKGALCYRFANQAQFHPLKYAAGLARLFTAAGGRIFTGSPVKKIEAGPPAKVRAAAGKTVEAHHVAVTTNAPISTLIALHAHQAPYRTYVVGAKIPRGAVARGLYWDVLNPFHYVRLAKFDDTRDVIIIGGEDHKTGQERDPESRESRLESWALEHFPAIRHFDFRWSGQVMESVDGLALIGRSPGNKNVYAATGDSGQGMTHGTLAGLIISDLIQGKKNPWAGLYDPDRMKVKSLPEQAKENLNVLAQYADWLTPSEISSVENIPPGEGAVIRRGLKKIAAYRDEKGSLHEFSAVCSHLGCLVTWNSLEGCWDCPCHGSRFDAEGKVISAPACAELTPLNLKEKPMKNVIHMLKADHKKVKKLFKDFEGLGDDAKKKKLELAREILHELTIHTKLEEDHLYPFAEQNADKEGRELVAEAEEEHEVAKSLIRDLEDMTPEDHHFSAKMKVLIDSVKHHIQEEENKFFPNIEKRLEAEDEEMSFEMEEEKEELMNSPSLHP